MQRDWYRQSTSDRLSHLRGSAAPRLRVRHQPYSAYVSTIVSPESKWYIRRSSDHQSMCATSGARTASPSNRSCRSGPLDSRRMRRKTPSSIWPAIARSHFLLHRANAKYRINNKHGIRHTTESGPIRSTCKPRQNISTVHSAVAQTSMTSEDSKESHVTAVVG